MSNSCCTYCHCSMFPENLDFCLCLLTRVWILFFSKMVCLFCKQNGRSVVSFVILPLVQQYTHALWLLSFEGISLGQNSLSLVFLPNTHLREFRQTRETDKYTSWDIRGCSWVFGRVCWYSDTLQPDTVWLDTHRSDTRQPNCAGSVYVHEKFTKIQQGFPTDMTEA